MGDVDVGGPQPAAHKGLVHISRGIGGWIALGLSLVMALAGFAKARAGRA